VVDAVEELRRLRPEVYPESKYPPLSKSLRYHNIFDFCMDTVTIDRSFPQIGDGGAWPSHKELPKIAWHDASQAAFEHAYRLTRDPKFAWALVNTPGWKPSAGFPLSAEDAKREAARWPDDWNQRSSLADGYGIAILRGGRGDQRRAFWMMYGRARSHTQDDIMDIGLAGFQGVLLSHMGYPRNWGYWEPSWTSHHLARQIPFENLSARAQLLADAGPVHVAEARAEAYLDHVEQGRGYELPPDQWQRRLLALVDVDAERFYCLDFYRISGGKEHWWAFHGQEGNVTTQGLDLCRQTTGTLAGPDVPYGDPKWLKANGCSEGVYGWSGRLFALAHLYNVQRATPAAPWSADYKFKAEGNLHLRLSVASDGAEVNLCDGTSPAGGKPYEMKWLMLHKKGADPVRSQILTAIEAYKGQPAIRRVEPVPVSGPDEQGFAPACCRVDLGHTTDWLLASADPAARRTAGPIEFAGRFGFVRQRDGQVVAMSLVGGTRLALGGVGITLPQAEYRARIVAVDRAAHTMTVAPAPPKLGALARATIFVENSDRRIAYPVIEASAVPQGVRLRLGYDSRIGLARATGAADGRLKTDTPLTLQYFRYYHGARLTNPEGSAEYRILDARTRGGVILDRERHPQASAARLVREFPAGSWMEIYDYGVGDEVSWPYALSLTLDQPGQYRVDAPVPVQVELPPGCRLTSSPR
jgi:hypothetical protein